MKIKFIIYLIIMLTSGLLLSAHNQDEIPEDVPIISYRIFPGQYESDEQFSHLLEFLKEYPDAGEADNKALISSQWRMAVLSPDKEKIYATHQGTTSLFEFNLKTQTITPLVRLCTDADLNSKGNLRGSRLAFLLADGKIHHLAHGPAVTVKERELNPAYQAHYVTYDLATKKRTDHGPLMAPGERRVCHADTLAILPDGRLFSLAWVETVDPARIEAMKSIAQGRPLYSKIINGPYYEVQLVELIKK